MQTFSDFLIYFLFIGFFLIYFFSKEAKKRVFKSKDLVEKKAVTLKKIGKDISSFPALKKDPEEKPKQEGKNKKSVFRSKIKAKNLKDSVILAEIFQRPDY